jgi:hypothetical protein
VARGEVGVESVDEGETVLDWNRDREPNIDRLRKFDESTVNMPREHEKVAMDKEMLRLMGKSLDDRTALLEKTMAELLKVKSEQAKVKITKETIESQVTPDVSDDDSESLFPVDSSSNFTRYKKSYMKSGPVYSVSRGKTRLEVVPEVQSLTSSKDVVGGFVKTRRMEEVERSRNQRIHQINGLANPFRSSRLNFLVHFHTAFYESRMTVRDDPISTIYRLSSHRPRNPTEELMKQVVDTTFDLEREVVASNGYKLPYIEVGMLMTESTLVKCLDLLRSEYRSLWFEQMKCMRVPGFHDDFGGFNTGLKSSKQQIADVVESQTKIKRAAVLERNRSTLAIIEKSTKENDKRKSRSVLGIRI